MQRFASRDVAAATPRRARDPKPRRRFPPEALTDQQVRALQDNSGCSHQPPCQIGVDLAVVPHRAGRARPGDSNSPAGLSSRTRRTQMRHTDPRLTENTYMDAALLPIASELQKVPAIPAASEMAPAAITNGTRPGSLVSRRSA